MKTGPGITPAGTSSLEISIWTGNNVAFSRTTAVFNVADGLVGVKQKKVGRGRATRSVMRYGRLVDHMIS